MHKLVRPLAEPSGLKSAKKRGEEWENLLPEERAGVRKALLEMQHNRCAYCERAVSEDKGHIEHFRKRKLYRDKTFEWKNLFYSCCENFSCGKLKDNKVHNQEENERLIDPCEENPEDFFVFDAQGKIAVRSTISVRDKQRADFTIKAFGLNDSRLVQARRGNLKRYEWLKEQPDEIPEHLKTIDKEPFITSIYHYFGQRLVPPAQS